MRNILLVIAVLLALGGCNDVDEETGAGITYSTLEYTDGTEVKGTNSGIVGKRLQVIRDSAEFSTFWSEHAAIFAPVPAQPAVDFSSNMLVAVFSGTKRSGGYSVDVIRVDEYPDFVDVAVEHTEPGSSCVTTSALTQPHHVVSIPAIEKPVVFTEVIVVNEC